MKELLKVFTIREDGKAIVDLLNAKLADVQKDYILYQVIEVCHSLDGAAMLLLVERR